MVGALILLLVLSSCGAPERDATTTVVREPDVALAPPGSRLRVIAPAATRIGHTLRYRAGAIELRFADATVDEGTERTIVEAYLATLAAQFEGAFEHRPFALDGSEGLQVTVRSARRRIRVLTVWRDGAISRLTLVHAPQDAGLAERVIETLRFDPNVALDPRAAMDLDADAIEDLPLLRVSTEQMIFREAGHAVPFPNAEAALDVTYVAFDAERPDERARGELLGARFRGLPIEAPELAPLEDARIGGFAMRSRATLEGASLALFGAYLELEEGAVLVRASVAQERAELWLPRFEALARSLRARAAQP